MEWRLDRSQQLVLHSDLVEDTAKGKDDTSSFLLELAASFANGLSDEDLDRLPIDGAENHDGYLYNTRA